MMLVAVPPGRAEPPPADTAPRTTITAAEEALWQRVAALEQASPATQPYEKWFATAEQNRAALLDHVRLYTTLYPGGAHRDDAIRIELATLFELGTLRGGDLQPLCERVTEYLGAPPSQAAEHEAAYWEIICQRLWHRLPACVFTDKLPVPHTQPVAQASSLCLHRQDAGATPWPSLDADLRAACRVYVERYPRSRHVPRLAGLLFEDAARRGDREDMRAAVECLGTHFPNHAATRAVLGEWNREESVGRSFWLACRTVDGRTLDTREYLGQPVVIVVWAGFDAAARQCVQKIEQFRKAHADLHVVGVSVDETVEATAAAGRELEIDWPQFNDGLGWGNEFVRSWGVTRLPYVFVVDRQGRLAGATAGDGWEAWARRSLGLQGDGPTVPPAAEEPGGARRPRLTAACRPVTQR